MKIIWLTRGQFTLVDDEDYEFLNQWKWIAQKSKTGFYAYRTENGNLVLMHRLILDLTDSKIFTDHKDRNGLNNQRHNLRIATQSENEANKVSHRDSLSKYFGVCWDKQHEKWKARICKNKTSIHLGYFLNEPDAALAYNQAAIMYHGEFASLNKI